MSSSTMIQGATRRRPSPQRTTVETATSPPSHAQSGTARAQTSAVSRAGRRGAATVLPAKARLAQTLRQLAGPRGVRADSNRRRGDRDLADDRLAHGCAARGLLERGGVSLGDPVDAVLALDELESGA